MAFLTPDKFGKVANEADMYKPSPMLNTGTNKPSLSTIFTPSTAQIASDALNRISTAANSSSTTSNSSPTLQQALQSNQTSTTPSFNSNNARMAYDANGNGAWIPNGEALPAGMSWNQPTANQTSSNQANQTLQQAIQPKQATDNSNLINQQYDTLLSSLKDKIQQSINSKNTEIAGLGQKYQPQVNQTQVDKYNNLRTALEQSANNGDRGGIGRQNALQTQTAADNNLNSIQLQKASEETALKNDIANLLLEGNVQEATLQSQRLQDLISNNQYVDTTNFNRGQSALQDALSVANVTGEFNGKPTYEAQQNALNRNDKANAEMGYVNPTANVVVPDSVRQQLAQYSNDYSAYAQANPSTTLGYYARVLANEKIFNSPELLKKYGDQFKTTGQKQNDFENSFNQNQFNYKQQQDKQQFDYQKQRDAVNDKQWQQKMNLDLRQQTFAEAQAKIENALAQRRISQEDASQALAWARFNADQDPNSIDNRLKQQQLDINSASKANSNLNNIVDNIDKLYTYKDPVLGTTQVNPNTTSSLRSYIIGLRLSDPETDQLLLRYGLPINP